MLIHKFTAAMVLAGACLSATPILAQSPSSLDAQLRAKGEAYSRAPDAEQNPDEVRTTQALNAEIVAQNELAQSQESFDAGATVEAQARYEADLAAAQSAQIQYEADVRAAEDARLRYAQELSDYEATVRACETGDRRRCAAGSQSPLGD